ncbi:peroxidase family protein [Medicago truncatula]|uniref:peroxidase n=1 Tax=Medicago truncatula TaxID=3880 RepID=G7J2Y8_MEDTR|nr:peroxidase family protein [Medicago truncatula]
MNLTRFTDAMLKINLKRLRDSHRDENGSHCRKRPKYPSVRLFANFEINCRKSNLGGPSWDVGLGRRDSITASRSDANNSIPAPFFNLSTLKTNFANQGLSVEDLVALSGAHTIGLARCVQFRAHIYNDSNVDPLFRKSLQNKCPRSGNDNVLEPFDYQTPTHFDNLYFKNLLAKKTLLHSDHELFNIGSSTNNLVRKYATNNAEFFKAFAEGMVKMSSSIKPLTGSNGQIRINCRKTN